VKLIPSIPQETDDVTSDFDNIVENAKDCGILFILLLVTNKNLPLFLRKRKKEKENSLSNQIK